MRDYAQGTGLLLSRLMQLQMALDRLVPIRHLNPQPDSFLQKSSEWTRILVFLAVFQTICRCTRHCPTYLYASLRLPFFMLDILAIINGSASAIA
jgi:hypothetical protein